MRYLLAGLVGLALLLSLVPAEAQQATGQRILEQRTVLLRIGHLLVEGECLGFRLYRPDFPSDVDLVLTAAHCVLDKGQNPIVAVEPYIRQASMFMNSGIARYLVTWREYDIALLLVTPQLGPLTPISNVWRQPPSGLPVLALIRVGRGRPTIASGQVLQREGWFLKLLLPAAPGTSGGGIVDVSGYPVGTIVRVNMFVQQSAGFMTEAVGMDLIGRLLLQQRDHLLEKARAISTRPQ